MRKWLGRWEVGVRRMVFTGGEIASAISNNNNYTIHHGTKNDGMNAARDEKPRIF
jgi:hypothetical protein